MSAKVKGINLTHNTDIKNLVPERLAVDPVNPVLGRIWFNTTEKVIKTTNPAGEIIVLGQGADIDLSGIDQDIIPATNGTINIGSATNRFKSIYVDEAYLSTNTLYIGETPILGTNADTVEIHADEGQSISIKTTGDATSTTLTSDSKVQLSTSGMNADVVLQASGAGSKVRIGSTAGTDVTGQVNIQDSMNIAGSLTLTGDLFVNGTQTVVDTTVLSVQDNIIDINAGELGNGVTAGTAGLRVKRGELTDMMMVFDEADDKFKVGANGSTLETLATREWVGTQDFGSGTSSGVTTLKYGSYEFSVGSFSYPVGTFIPYATTVDSLNTIPTTQKVDNTTILLKAGKTYKVEGGITAYTASSGVIAATFGAYKTDGTLLYNIIGDFTYTSNTSPSAPRNYQAQGYYTPTQDCYLKLKVSTNSLASPTGLETAVTVTEYDSVSVINENVTQNVYGSQQVANFSIASTQSVVVDNILPFNFAGSIVDSGTSNKMLLKAGKSYQFVYSMRIEGIDGQTGESARVAFFNDENEWISSPFDIYQQNSATSYSANNMYMFSVIPTKDEIVHIRWTGESTTATAECDDIRLQIVETSFTEWADDVYSLEETVTNKVWMGQRVYRKVFYYKFTATASAVNDVTINSGLDMLTNKPRVSDYVIYLTDGTSITHAESFFNSDIAEYRSWMNASGQIAVYVPDSNAGVANAEVYVTVEYIKP